MTTDNFFFPLFSFLPFSLLERPFFFFFPPSTLSPMKKLIWGLLLLCTTAALMGLCYASSATSAVAEMASGKVLVTGTFTETDTVSSITLKEDALSYTCTLDTLTNTTLTCTCPGLDTYPNAPDSASLYMEVSFAGLPHVFPSFCSRFKR